jgi:hypothetical protein
MRQKIGNTFSNKRMQESRLPSFALTSAFASNIQQHCANVGKTFRGGVMQRGALAY